MELLSIKEFSQRANVSVQAIYKRLDKDLKPYKVIENGKTKLNAKALERFKTKEEKPTPNNDKALDILNEQLKAKDEQIKALSKLLETEKATNQALTMQILQNNETIRLLVAKEEEPKEEPQNKKSFFSKLFNMK